MASSILSQYPPQRIAVYARISTKAAARIQKPNCWRCGNTPRPEGFRSSTSCRCRNLGAKDRRPELDRLMSDARRRRFDTVLVARFDRFARSTRHLVLALDEFNALESTSSPLASQSTPARPWKNGVHNHWRRGRIGTIIDPRKDCDGPRPGQKARPSAWAASGDRGCRSDCCAPDPGLFLG